MSTKEGANKLDILFPCMPDIEKAIGGVKQLYRHAEILEEYGYNARIITENKNFRPSWFESDAKTICISEIKDEILDPAKTVVVLPETYAGVDQGNIYGWDARKYKKVIFNQNAYYTTKGYAMERIDKFYGDNEVLHILAISEDTYNYLNKILSQNL